MTIEPSTVAERVARLRAELRSTPASTTDLARALDDVGRALDRLERACGDDEVALDLSTPRALAASYVVATKHLAEVGADQRVCVDLLRRGSDLVGRELAAVERSIETKELELGRR